MPDTHPPLAEAAALIARLGLLPHPEGGHYREIYRDRRPGGGRGTVTAIYYLLQRGERSHWHRIDATEIWHFHGGAPLLLSLSADGREVRDQRLGLDVGGDERPQLVVPPGCWQAAESLGSWTLVGCTVAPAFEFTGFDLAPPGWIPGAGPPAR
jgi:predicted cupin superfamily sugar epimerase